MDLKIKRFFVNKPKKETVGYGIDLGSRFTKTAVVEKQGDKLVLVDFDIRETPVNAIKNNQIVDEEAISEFLSIIKREVELPRNKVRIAIPNIHVGKSLKTLIPSVVNDKEKKKAIILNNLIADQAKRALINDCYFDFIETEEGKTEKKVNVHEVKKHILEKYCKVFYDAGINPLSVDFDQFALVRPIMSGIYDKGDISIITTETIMIVEFGHQNTNIIICRRGVPVVVHNIPKGGEHLTQAIVKNTGLTVAEAEMAKTKEESRTEEYYIPILKDILQNIVNVFTEYNSNATYRSNRQGAEIERIFITGGGSGFANLRSVMNKNFNKVIRFGEPASLKVLDIDRWEQKKIYSNIAIGLAGQFFYC